MFKFLIRCFLFLVVASAVHAQADRVVSTSHIVHRIKSQAVGEDRTILVRVPASYERSDARYPVVYMLDAEAPQNAMMAGIVEQQAWSGVMPEVILVGIRNTNRTRDMTATRSERGGGGGAQKFLQFIESEVIPFVDKNYRTEPYRILAGHSLAGLFTTYVFTERPDAFSAYVAASPHLQWDNNHFIKYAEEKLRNRSESNKRLFLTIGDEPDYLESFEGFQTILRKAKIKKLEYEFRQFKDENHGSVVLPTYFAGLRSVYAGWNPRTTATLGDIETHYRNLSTRYGYTIKPPEALVNQLGYQLLRAGDTRQAIEIFKKNVESYPRSANVYDSLGEALERSGDNAQARELYEKAWRMAEQSGETQVAAAAKANFERLAAKAK